MTDILWKIVDRNRPMLEERKRLIAPSDLARRAEQAPAARPYREALTRPELSVIAEIKRASPTKGLLRPDLDVSSLARSFEANGAQCLSVITEEYFFLGSLDHLREARQAVKLPLLRKDFLFDPYQVYQARSAGADAVLLIVALLELSLLRDMIALAQALGMASQVEVHDEHEVERALRAGAGIIGINNRDLRSFTVDLGTTERLMPRVPPGIVVVSESGMRSGADVRRLLAAGVHAVHIGETFMVAPDPGQALRQLIDETARVTAS